MIYPELAERLVEQARKDSGLAIRLLRAVGEVSAERYLLLPPVEQDIWLVNLTGRLLADQAEHSILSEIESYEAEKLQVIDLTGLTKQQAKAVDDRRYIRGLINTLKYSPTALRAILQQYPFHRTAFESALRGESAFLPKLHQIVLDNIGRENLQGMLVQYQGYDLEAEVSKYQPYDAIGEVLHLPADDAAFKQAMRERRHWVYNKFTVTPTEVDGVRSWLVFFA